MDKLLTSPLLANMKDLLRGYTALLLFGVFTPLLYLTAPLFGHAVAERVANSRSLSTLLVLVVIAVLMMIAYTAMELLRSTALERMGSVIDDRLTRRCFDVFNRDHSVDGPSPSQAMADLSRVRGFLSGNIIGMLIDGFWSPIFILVMFLIHPVYGIVILVQLGVAGTMAYVTQRAVAESVGQAQVSEKKAGEFALSVSRSSEAMRAMGMMPQVVDRWYSLHRESLGWRSDAKQRASTLSIIPRFINNSQVIIIYSTGAFLFLANQVHIGVLFMALLIMMRALGPMQYLIGNWQSIQSFIQSARRLDALLRAELKRPDHMKLPQPNGPLVVQRLVGFPPGSDKVVINDVSFVLGSGRVLGIVGPSGAGKSCLGRLVVGVWKPRRGTVVFGEHDIGHWNEDDLGPYVGYMPQDVEFLPGTVGENISRFDPEATPETILAAVDMAGIHDLIRAMPQGYATPIGTGGHVLSGGQRQRLALARAVYGRPRLVVLDEPNSNLDAASEQILGQTVNALRNDGATVVVVSHRVSLLGFCDDVLVLAEGAVQAYGPREQIFNRLPRLKQTPQPAMIEEQSGADIG